MHWLFIVFCSLCALRGFKQASTVKSESYVAAVVEYYNSNTGATLDEQLRNRVDDYVAFIHNEAAAEADIMVFPESSLNDASTAQFVPDASDHVVPCLEPAYDSNPIQTISCAARNRTIYVLINLTMKQVSDGGEEVLLYNTNVVFDRKGAVISVYRKFNLFGEAGISITSTADLSTFETDFGVEFGHFICFDILFASPPNDLIRRGITNFAFPARWYSSMPLLTAAQQQHGWAFAHNVNLLAAGSNRPAFGNTGTGIYAGRQGTVRALMNAVAESTLFVAAINKVPGDGNAIVIGTDTNTSYITPKIKLWPDDGISNFHYVRLEPNVLLERTVCDSAFCCSVEISMTENERYSDSVHYTYFLAYYSGPRSFDGLPGSIGQFCAVVACPTGDPTSCGQVFSSDSVVQQRYVFTHLKLNGTFRAKSEQVMSVTMPTTLTSSLMPFPVDWFSFVDADVRDDKQLVEMTLLETQRSHRFFTFGISSQDFSGSSSCIVAPFLMVMVVALGITMHV